MRRREIFIELTSLLDVILIMIFVLLTQARTQTAQALESAQTERQTAQELQADLESAREELGVWQENAQGLERQLLSRDLVTENSRVITLSVSADHSIRLECRGESPSAIPYDWADETYASNRLRSELLQLVRGAGEQAVFIVFQYDREQIYYAQHAMITGVVREVRLETRQLELPLSYLELDTRENGN